MTEITYDLGILSGNRKRWRESPGLRRVYGDLYAEIRKRCAEGRTLEIGSGIGVAKEFFDRIETSDVAPTAYADRVVSAYSIVEDAGGGWANIFALDVLHHLRFPLCFLRSASEALRPGGRLLLLEPAATAGGRAFYRLFHHEPVDLQAIEPPFEFAADADGHGFANMAMAEGLFRRWRTRVREELEAAGLRLREIRYRDLFAYPLTGGYSRPQLLPACCLAGLLVFERRLPQAIFRLLGLRMLVVLEKKESGGGSAGNP